MLLGYVKDASRIRSDQIHYEVDLEVQYETLTDRYMCTGLWMVFPSGVYLNIHPTNTLRSSSTNYCKLVKMLRNLFIITFLGHVTVGQIP